MSHRITFLCLSVVLAVFVVLELAPGVCCLTLTRRTTPSHQDDVMTSVTTPSARRHDAMTRSTTPSRRDTMTSSRHDTVINIRPTQHDRTHGRDGPITVEVGPLVWNHERGTWSQVTEPSKTTPDKQNTTAASIIIAPDLECDEGEVKDMNGVCREDWGRMMAPVNTTTTSGRWTTTTSVPAASGRGIGRGVGGGAVASSREPATSGRGERRSCPSGQAMDQHGQCRQERGRRN